MVEAAIKMYASDARTLFQRLIRSGTLARPFHPLLHSPQSRRAQPASSLLNSFRKLSL